MTRINIGIKPKILSRQHLLAEHRELVRIPNNVAQGKVDLKAPLPEKFTLGKGHVRFFYDKLGYLFLRYLELHNECIERGYNVKDYSDSWKGIPKELMNNYKPTKEDIMIIKGRLLEKDFNHYSKLI